MMKMKTLALTDFAETRQSSTVSLCMSNNYTYNTKKKSELQKLALFTLGGMDGTFYLCIKAACAAARRAMGTRNGEQET
jgi:hypothetical protein